MSDPPSKRRVSSELRSILAKKDACPSPFSSPVSIAAGGGGGGITSERGSVLLVRPVKSSRDWDKIHY